MSDEYMPVVYFVCANCGRKLYGCNTRHPDHADGPNRGMNRCAQSDNPDAEAQATPVRLRGAFAERGRAIDDLERIVDDLTELTDTAAAAGVGSVYFVPAIRAVANNYRKASA